MNDPDLPDPDAGLYLVATPIGNLKDITLRALETLRSVDVILCEDTRTSAKLLSAYEIKTRCRAYHDHSDDKVRNEIIQQLSAGKSMALISDAGMPLVSDPGFKLVQMCRDAGLMVTSLPGANAPLTALQLSGLPSHAFSFIGFLPPKSKAATDTLQKWENSPSTLVFYEAKQRIIKTLNICFQIFGGRTACVARELTKKFEEVITAPLPDLIEHLEGRDELKGEFVILIAPAPEKALSDEDLVEEITSALSSGEPVSRLSVRLASETGRPKKDIYALALGLKNQ